MKKIKHILFQIGILTVLLSATFSQATAALPSITSATMTDPPDTCTVVAYDTVVVSPLEMPYHYADTTFDFGTPDTSTFVFHDVAANGCDSITNLLFLYRANYKRACYEYHWWVTGGIYTESGMYFHHYLNDLGEQATDTLFLTIYSPSVEIDPIQPVTMCRGENAEISASVTGEGNMSYEWDGPYHHFYTTESEFSIVNASAIDSGSYTMIATATEGPCTAMDTATVEVTVLPAPELEITGSSDICYGESVTLTVTGAEGYHWSNGPTTSTITVSPSMSTTYSVSSTGQNGCVGHADIAITVHSQPVVNVTGKAVICSGESLNLNASGASSYEWNPSINVTPTNTGNSPVQHEYFVTGTDDYGCTATASFTVTVNPLPHVSISGDSSICAGESVTLNASGAASYVWSEGSSTVSPTQTTSYSVVGTNAYGCTGTASKTVTVYPLPNVSISGGGSICKGESVVLTVSGATSYDWIGGNSTSYHASPAASHTYTVTGTDNETGCSNTAHTTVIVNPLPDVFIIGNREICVGEELTLTAGGAYTYSWNHEFPDYPTENTTYTVTGTDANQCQNTASVNVIVHNPPVTIVGTDSICEGATFLLIASGARTYEWSDGSGETYLTDTLSVTTSYSVTGTDEYGCTQADTFQVIVGQGAENTVEVTACELYVWPITKDTLRTSGTYFFNYMGDNGCASFHRLDLTITHGDTTRYEMSACEEFTWDVTGVTYTESGSYTHSYTTPEGCNNIDILELTINHGDNRDTTVAECERYTWPVTGRTYFVSDDYIFNYSDTNGCDCSRTLHLTINHGTYEAITATGTKTYTWAANSNTYSESGTYEHHYVNEDGCECTQVLFLTINHDGHDCIHAYMQTPESCPNGENGVAVVHIPASIKNDCVIEWTDSKTGEIIGSSEVLSGLSKGKYGVKVKSVSCSNVVFFNGAVVISKMEECDVHVRIEGPTNVDGGCNGLPKCTFRAYASGGTPPYTFHEGWVQTGPCEAKRDFTPHDGHFTVGCLVKDAENIVGHNILNGYAKNMNCAQDPNEIKGPIGFDDSLRYVNATDKMHYTIDFENDPDFAMAPATRVSITYDVPANQRLSSFRLADFGFGDFIFTVPSNTSTYSQRLDVSDSLGVWVDVNAGIDVVNHQLFWIFQSIDPATGAEPVSSQMGFLPINDSLEHGEGYVSFYILPDAGVQTGDTVTAEALIVFDDNAPIGTNVWHNTFDAVAPTSTLHTELNAQDSLYCTFSFTAQDDQGGSGVGRVETFVSINNDAYISIGSCHPDSTLTYTLENGLTYQFVSIATDNVGNTEPFKTVADTTINFNGAPIDLVLNGTVFYENVPLNTYIGTFVTIDNDINQPFEYELVNGAGSTDNILFQIVNNELRTNTLFECSQQTEYSIRVRSTDAGGLSIEKEFVLSEIITHETPVTYLNANICEGESYSFRGRTLTTSGIYTDTLSKSNGCDSLVTLFLTVNPAYHTAVSDEICTGGSYYFFGQNLTAAGTYTHTLQSVSGCDSVVSLTLAVRPNYNTPVTAEICNDDSYNFFGQALSTPGTYTHTLQSASGCDSVITLTLTVGTAYYVPITTEICQGESYDFFGQTITTTGTYTHTLQSVSGCDSVFTLNLTVKPNHSKQFTTEICQGESYNFFGQALTTSGSYTQHLQAANGCDSAYTLNLIVLPSYNIPVSAAICAGDSYEFFDQTLTSAGTYTETLRTESGCDSVITLNLTVNQPVYGIDVRTACDSLTWIDGVTYFENDSVSTYVLTAANGCDSIVTLYLAITHVLYADVYETACGSYTWGGTTYSQSGEYTRTVTSGSGCDSVITLHLTINQPYQTPVSATICQGESYNFFGQTLTTAGAYNHTLQTVSGCDSVITLNLTVNPAYNIPILASICDGESYSFFGQALATAGAYTHTLQTVHGCDSVIALTLTVNPTFEVDIYDTAIREHQYTFGDLTITPTDSGTYTYDFQYSSEDGCDSVVHLILYVQFNDGVEVYDSKDVEIFPNPTSAILNIKGENMRQIQIYNADGQLVFTKEENIAELQRVDVSQFASGQYLVKVLLDDGRTVTKKFIVHRQ